MENLRWILLVVGVIVIAGVFLVAQKKRGEKKRDRAEPNFEDWNSTKNNLGKSDPLFVEAQPDSFEVDEISEPRVVSTESMEEPVAEPEIAITPEPMAQLKPAAPIQEDFIEASTPSHSKRLPAKLKLSELPEKIVVLQVVAPEGQPFSGKALHISFQCAGMTFGDMNIYHRSEEGAKFPLFSSANLVEPGYFPQEDREEFSTPGINLFMQLPHQFDPVYSFEEMLKSAKSIAADLKGKLQDGRRCELTQQGIEHLREEMHQYRHTIDIELKKQNVTA